MRAHFDRLMADLKQALRQAIDFIGPPGFFVLCDLRGLGEGFGVADHGGPATDAPGGVVLTAAAGLLSLASVAAVRVVDDGASAQTGLALAELLGLDDMLPVTVERKWVGNSGALSWWLPVKMDEVQRHKQKMTAPDGDAWNNQMYKIRFFDQFGFR